MLSIKFKNQKQIPIKKKIEIINNIFDIIGIKERKDFFYSDYTFSKVEDSKTIRWLDDLLESNILKDLDIDDFITIIAESSYGSIRVEINPSKVRKKIFNCSHIDFNLENDALLYDVLKENRKITQLVTYFDKISDLISEFYFFDSNKSLDCYSDIDTRLFLKVYDEIEFSYLLLKKHQYRNKLEEKTVKAIAFNFTNQIFQEEHQPFIQNMIRENNLNVACAAGSLKVHGSDVPRFMNLIREKLEDYIERIMEKDIYKTEFDNVFKNKNLM